MSRERNVRSLPAIDLNGRRWRLPLSDQTLLRLADALLTADAESRATCFEAAVREDPALALWTICKAWHEHRREISTPAEAVTWLDSEGLATIAGDDEPPIDNHPSWLDCVAESSRRRVLAEATESHDPWLAMVSNLRQWLAVGESKRMKKPIVLENIAPTWLQELAEEEFDSAEFETNEDVSESVEHWRREQPLASDLFLKAWATRSAMRALETKSDEHFLREKLASLKEFTYGASHELNNPLFNISGRAQVLLRDEEDPERRRKLSTIYAHAMRASEMINDIALAARTPKPELADVDAVAVVREIVAELQPMANEQSTRLEAHEDPASLMVEADGLQLAVAVREICINALESLKRCPRRGEVTVSVSQPDSDSVAIAVADNGPGLDARVKRHLFDPFFSGYEAGRGLGFGLTKCWQIAQAHGGAIVVDSQPDHGSTFTIQLPVRQSVAAEKK